MTSALLIFLNGEKSARMRCLHCGKDIDESLLPSGLTYCPYCGQNLQSSLGERFLNEMSFCPYCGKELSVKASFCPYCGKELDGKVNFCPYCGRELARRIITYEEKQEASKPTDFRAKPIKSIIKIPISMRRQDKLYKQWTKYADLPPEDVPSGEIPRDMPVREGINLRRLPVLYILLGVCIVILVVGFTLLIVKSC